jgi:hypothetical protein
VIHKTEKHQIQISLAWFRGQTRADLRLFVLKDGVWIPTQKGCTVGVEQLGELEEAVGRLRDASDLTTHPPF